MRNRRADLSAVFMGLGALLIAICFVLPWITVSGPDLSGTQSVFEGPGWELAKEGLVEEGDAPYLWLMPVVAILGLGWAIYAGYRNFASTVSAIVGSGIVVLALLGVGLFLIKWFTDDTIESVKLLASGFGANLNLGYGVWGTLVAVVTMLMAALVAFTVTEEAYGPIPRHDLEMPMPPPPSAPVSPPQPAPAPPPPTQPAAPPRPAQQQAPRREPTQPIGAPAQPVGWLVARSGSRSGQSYGLKQGDNTVGRDSSQADILLDDPTVSGEHARVRFEGGQFYLYDLASSNGTFVNGRRVQRQMLMDNDVVSFGEAELVFKKV